ncbi:hypothetical protein BDR06DRAFT_958591 [Suillus hirtellus]|nr:hypothetical protein BDR06DRAFT_958591 [Suillus hirtellus]
MSGTSESRCKHLSVLPILRHSGLIRDFFFYLSEASSGAHLLAEGTVFRTANCILVFLVLLQSSIIHIVLYHYNDSGPSAS